MAPSKQPQQIAVQYRSIAEVKPHPHNARTHTSRQIQQVAESIRVFGFTNPILLDRKDRIAAGHARLEAAKSLAMTQVPTISLADLTDDQVRAYMIADNKLAESAGWDKEILAIEFQHLLKVEGLDIGLTITGFEVPEIDLIIGDAQGLKESAEDEPVIATGVPTSRAGDIWQLGRHRILCGSALDDASFQQLMSNTRADAVFTDPPYNVKIDGHATGNGRTRHREFAMATGEMTGDEYLLFLKMSLAQLIRYSGPGAVHYICMDWRHIATLLAAGDKQYESLLNLCVWVKSNGGMGSFYRSQHELIAVYRTSGKSHRNNVQLGRFGRNRTNVWQYAGTRALSKNEDENISRVHPTVKPVDMVADALLDCTKRGDIVLDPFLGSGTTLIAADRTGRSCNGIEIDPLYVDTAILRWQLLSGNAAVHAVSKQDFNDVMKEARNDGR